MQLYILTITGLVLFGTAYLAVEHYRFLTTLFLITQTSPYTQVGTGTGNILIIGDSTGYGTGVKDARDSIAGRIGADYPTYSIVNRSHNGDTLATASNRLTNLSGQYDLILLQLGANDLLQKQPLTDSLQTLDMLYSKLRDHTNQIVMMSFGDVGSVPAFTAETALAYTRASAAYHHALTEFAATRDDFTYINLYQDPLTDPFVQDPNTYLAADGLHPSAAGYAVWYTSLQPVLKRLLEQP